MAIDMQLGDVMNCQSTALYSWNCPLHEWSNFRKSLISDEHASEAILRHYISRSKLGIPGLVSFCDTILLALQGWEFLLAYLFFF